MPEHDGLGIPQNQYRTFEIDILNLATGTVPPDAVARDRFRGYSFDINDDGDFEFKVPQDWVPGTDINVDILWCINEDYATTVGEIKWRLNWESVANDGTQLVGTGTAGQESLTDVAVPTLSLQLTESIYTIAAADLARRDLVRCFASRVALTGGGANPVADPEIYSVTIEYAAFFSFPK